MFAVFRIRMDPGFFFVFLIKVVPVYGVVGVRPVGRDPQPAAEHAAPPPGARGATTRAAPLPGGLLWAHGQPPQVTRHFCF